jgi:hypothetical protein
MTPQIANFDAELKSAMKGIVTGFLGYESGGMAKG